MPEIAIRKLQVFDLADFKDLCDEKEWYYPQVSMAPHALMKYEAYRSGCYVAYDDSELIGYIYGAVLCDTLYPQFMFVREAYRKRGIGKMLMEALEKNSGCSVSLIYYNKELSAYYQKQGYEMGTNLEVGMKQIGSKMNEA
ncbi:MAG: GNAT family N-acetyltransferase [Clostridiales bacterium]|nr:GNAT family N-acetyltransferase [Clostridiales bacterium]